MQRMIRKNLQVRTMCSSISKPGTLSLSLTLESALTQCKSCEFFESGGNKCRAFSYTTKEMKTTESPEEPPKFATILEARGDPRLCGIEGKMYVPQERFVTNIILGVVFVTPCAMFVISKIAY